MKRCARLILPTINCRFTSKSHFQTYPRTFFRSFVHAHWSARALRPRSLSRSLSTRRSLSLSLYVLWHICIYVPPGNSFVSLSLSFSSANMRDMILLHCWRCATRRTHVGLFKCDPHAAHACRSRARATSPTRSVSRVIKWWWTDLFPTTSWFKRYIASFFWFPNFCFCELLSGAGTLLIHDNYVVHLVCYLYVYFESWVWMI